MTVHLPVAIPLHPGPGAGFDQPFEMLAACHERVARMLGLLQRLQAHLQQRGADASASSAARDVMRYFDQAAPQHHLDEERHVFPLLRASADPRLVALAGRLQAEHRTMAAAWAVLRGDLQAVAEGRWPAAAPVGPVAGPAADPVADPVAGSVAGNGPSAGAAAHGAPTDWSPWQGFVTLYQGHAQAEDDTAYPAVARLLDADACAAMGREMAQRRGLPSAG